jgi:hypothetical protein
MLIHDYWWGGKRKKKNTLGELEKDDPFQDAGQHGVPRYEVV